MKEKYDANSMEKPEKKIGKPTLKQRRNWYSIKTILGAYLIYLSWHIGTGIFHGEVTDHVIWLGIAAGIFCVFGVILIILNIHSLRTDKAPDDGDSLPKDKPE